MIRTRRKFTAIMAAVLSLAALCAMSLSSALGAEFHVSPAGDDKNSGSRDKPVATLARARDLVRPLAGKEPCVVILQKGVYRLDVPLQFGPADSGSKDALVVYRAKSNAEVVLTGGRLISSPWLVWKDGVYRTQVGKMDPIDQLFIEGKRQIMARYPDLGTGFDSGGKGKSDRSGGVEAIPYQGCAPDAWSAKKTKSWADPSGAFMHGMHSALWGSQHYRVMGKKSDGELEFEGGWQNNQARSSHANYRMIENIFEELDARGEWYHDTKGGWLYYKPAEGIDMKSARVEAVLQIKHLVEIYGAAKQPVAELDIENSGNDLAHTIVKTYETTEPVKYLHFEGIRFTGTSRTFMETIEPLLRGDWCVYRGGAVHLRGTENVTLEKCVFEELGGNAVFVDGYNRGTVIRGNRFSRNGASDVNLVGSFAAVRDPRFNYKAPARLIATVDSAIGPKTEEYPADCLVEDNLMTLCGRFEKQPSGINISMSSRITVRHNTISQTPRAAINVNDGTWGGHLIEWNDCFATVLETSDHGSLNAWGRDRYWHSAGASGPWQKDANGKPLISLWIEKDPNSPRWDAYQTTVIRNNRMQCDHGWDIDLDDGCSNYEVYNNLCLGGGLKTREGYYRTVVNNVILARGYTCNVPYPKPTHDVFERNILWGSVVYNASDPELWGGSRNYNFVHNREVSRAVPAVGLQQQAGDDAHSLYGNAGFVAPEKGDFSVTENSPTLGLGFKNFPMSGFGVTSPELVALADVPRIQIPVKIMPNSFKKFGFETLYGATFKSLNTDAELTATAMQEKTGVLLVSVPKGSGLAQYGFEADDVILEINGEKTPTAKSFIAAFNPLKQGSHTAKVWRRMKDHTLEFSK